MRIVVVILASGLIALSTVAGAEEAVETGWWWRAQTKAFPLPAPPTIPEGALVVGSAPDSPTEVAALRAFLPSDVGRVTLTLEVHDSTGAAMVQACRTSGAWTPQAAGAWDERPRTRCDEGRVSGEADEGGAVWRFDVTLLVREGLLDIAFMPGEEQDAAPRPFQIVFAPPDTDAIDADALPAQGAAGVPQPREEPDEPTPVRVRDQVTSAQPVLPADPSPEARLPGATGPVRSLGPSSSPLGTSGSTERNRAAAAGLLTAGAAALGTVWARQRGAGAEERGVGRYTGARSGTPPPL